MDIPIHTLKSTQGIPIFYEEYPEIFRPMSILLVVFSGSADDGVVNVPGIHHWAEHIPFRGTERFPQGSKEIMGFLRELGGGMNAYTTELVTVYHAQAPSKRWRDAAEIVVDLAARPLLRREDIEAERAIIEQEINDANARIGRRSVDLVKQSLMSGHPLGGSVIGTKESLARAGLEAIIEMREKSYGRNRCALFVSGSMKPEEVQSVLSELLERMPDNPVSIRRMPASYGPLPEWRAGEHVTLESEFDTTFVGLAFPVPAMQNDQRLLDCYASLDDLLTEGGTASPLINIVREQRQLAYSCGVVFRTMPDGGTIMLTAKTSRDKVDDVIEAFWDVLEDPTLRSSERWEFTRRVCEGEMAMYLPNPLNGVHRIFDDAMHLGRARTMTERFDEVSKISHEGVLAVLSTLTRDRGRVITLLGK